MILPKDYLSIHDVGEYLYNNHGYDYDPEIPDSYSRLCGDIFDLVLQDKLDIVFRYTGEIESHIDIYTDIEDMQTNEVSPINVDSLVTPIEASGFFYFNNNKYLREVLIEKQSLGLPLKGFFTPVDNSYILSILQNDLFISKYKEDYEIRQAYFIDTSDHLRVQDLFIPIESLNTLFNIQMDNDSENYLKNQVTEQELEIQQLNEKLSEAKRQIDELKRRIESNDELLISSNAKAFDWHSMNEYTYPPELHLAIEIWKELYTDDQFNIGSKFNTPKFNAITNRIGPLDKNLRKRLRTILTPINSKNSAPTLYNNLKNIKILNINED